MREKSLGSSNRHVSKEEATMNSTHVSRNRMGLREKWRTHRLRRRFRHDRWLVLNMATFNFEGGWDRTFNPLRASATVRC